MTSRWPQKAARWEQASSGANKDLAMCSLPSHVWCWLARYGDIRDFGVVLQCSTSLFSSSEADALWHYHAFTAGHARPVVRAGLDWIYPFMPEVVVDQCIDWKRFLRRSCETIALPSLWVRIRDIDLRMPLPSPSTRNSLVAVLNELRAITYFERVPPACQFPAVKHVANKSTLELQLRLLQWAGRPGPVLHDVVMAGDHLMLEWGLSGDRGLPLPVHSHAMQATLARGQRGHLFPGSTLFAAWRRGYDSTVVSNFSASETTPSQRLILVRIISSVLYNELWLLLDLSTATVGSLYTSIETSLRSNSCRHELRGSVSFEMMDSLHPNKKHNCADDTLLRSLCWTHSETLILEHDSKIDICAATSHVFRVWREDELTQKGCAQTDGTPQVVVQDTILSERMDAQMQLTSTAAPTSMPLQIQDALGAMQRPPMWWDDEDNSSQRGTCPMRDASQRRNRSPIRKDPACVEEVLHERANGFSAASRSTAWLARNPGDTAVEADADSSWERLAPHYAPKLLKNTHQTRQFEFHPSLPQVLLTGDKKGGVNVVDTDQAEIHPPLIVDTCPVLGLAWMRHHPQSAVCGAAHSGQIRFLKYDLQANPREPALQHVFTVDEFPKLSSLSINCTDDFLLASGFTHDLALYDTHTGQVLHRVLGVHNHFINISRFAHRSPHVFATASFDHSCKVWDCRQPLLHNRPVKVLQTGGLNVMCTFSPDDKYLLSSGIDTRITQFELPSFTHSPASFPLRPAMHQARYRRSMYFATGRHFVTAATDESHIRIMSATGKNLGVVDFCGLLGRTNPSLHRPLPPGEMPLDSHVPRRSRMIDRYGCKLQRGEGREEPRMMWEDGTLRHGEVQLDDDQMPSAADARSQKEYVQSVRTHPIVENRVGVLLSSYHPDPQSYIAFVHLDPNYSNSD